jgi:hypothetical protein
MGTRRRVEHEGHNGTKITMKAEKAHRIHRVIVRIVIPRHTVSTNTSERWG